MGRPLIFDEEKDKQLKAFCRLKPTLADCAAFFECDIATIENHIRKTHGITFSEFRDQNMVHTRFSLIRKAIQRAESGSSDAMHIFALKNLCGWADKHEAKSEVKETKEVVYAPSIKGMEDLSKEEIMAEIAKYQDRPQGKVQVSVDADIT